MRTSSCTLARRAPSVPLFATFRRGRPRPARPGARAHVDSLAFGGNGVARLDGFVVFVRRGLPGDTVRARVTKVQRRHAEAVADRGAHAGARARRGAVRALPGLRRLPLPGSAPTSAGRRPRSSGCATRCSGSQASPTCRSSRSSPPRRFRLPQQDGVLVHASSRTGPTLGLHEAGRWDEVLEIDKCWLTTDLGNAIRNRMRDWAREEKLAAYDQETHEGYLRHLVDPRRAQHGPGARPARDRTAASASTASG